MRSFRQLCFAAVLTSVLAVTALAGETQTPPCVAGEIGCPGVAGEISTPGIAGDTQTPGIAGETQTPGLLGDVSTPGFLTFLWPLLSF